MRQILVLTLVAFGCAAGMGDEPGNGGNQGSPAGSGGAGGPTDSPPLGPPITVPPESYEHWIWVPIPAMRCADDSPAGLFVNFTQASRDLVIFFQGGGACWDTATCLANQVGGLGLFSMGTDPLATFPAPIGIFDRGDETNPLRHSNYIVIPYCTMDGHVGNKVATYAPQPHHVGFANVAAALPRIVATFPDAPNLVVAGFSAGGIGATGNYHQIAAAFERVRQGSIALIVDAGPLLRPSFLSMASQSTLRDSWGLDKTIGLACPECVTDGMHMGYRKIAQLHPGIRSSLICAYNDQTVRLMYGALGSPVELGLLQTGLGDLADWRASVDPAIAPSVLHEFYYASDRHGAIEYEHLSDTPGLADFLSAQLSGARSWTSVR
jgi:hypothetical protein